VTTKSTPLLLFMANERDQSGGTPVERLLVVGDRLDKQRVAQIAQDTLGVSLRPMDAADVDC